MIALDTNLLARLLLRDDAAQYKKVKALFETRQVFTAPVTVMLVTCPQFPYQSKFQKSKVCKIN